MMPYALGTGSINNNWNTAGRWHRGRPTLSPQAVLPYAGPGDITLGGGATVQAWGGLRAYSNATIGTNCAIIARSGGSSPTTQTFVTTNNGLIDIAGIAAFKAADGSTALAVNQLYDQTGNGKDLVATGTAPALILNGIGSLPVIEDNSGTGGHRLVISTLAVSAPFTVSMTCKRLSNFTTQMDMYVSNGGPQAGPASSANAFYLYNGGSVPTASCSDSTMHALQLVTNGASSDINVDGTVNTVNPTGANNLAAAFNFIHAAGNIDTMECGIWSGIFNATDSSHMSANQHGFWGF